MANPNLLGMVTLRHAVKRGADMQGEFGCIRHARRRRTVQIGLAGFG